MGESGLDPSVAPALRERIFDVLKDADLSVVSAKKIRASLAELPEGSLPAGVDLSAQKKAIDAEIRVCYDEVTKGGKSSAQKDKITLPGAGGVPGDTSKERTSKRKSTETTKKGSKKRTKDGDDEEPKKKRASNPNSALNRPMRLSSEMAEVCGGNEQLWAYIKEKNLQNESNKRQILCDEKLTSLFGKSTVDMQKALTQLIGPHLEKIEVPT